MVRNAPSGSSPRLTTGFAQLPQDRFGAHLACPWNGDDSTHFCCRAGSAPQDKGTADARPSLLRFDTLIRSACHDRQEVAMFDPRETIRRGEGRAEAVSVNREFSARYSRARRAGAGAAFCECAPTVPNDPPTQIIIVSDARPDIRAGRESASLCVPGNPDNLRGNARPCNSPPSGHLLRSKWRPQR